jgi:hypothetical protein
MPFKPIKTPWCRWFALILAWWMGWGVTACFFSNPSPDDVLSAMEASLRSLQDSMTKDYLRIHQTYGNAADLSYMNDDRTLLHTVQVRVQETSVSVAGECTFADFEDARTRYRLNGTLTYHLRYDRNFDAASGSGEVRGELALLGARVRDLDYAFTVNTDGKFKELTVVANGRTMDMSRYVGALNFMHYVIPLSH